MEDMSRGEPLTEDTVLAGVVNERPVASNYARSRPSASFVRKLSRAALMQEEGRSSTFEQAIEEGKLPEWMPIDES